MSDYIYRQILEDSVKAYLHIRIIKDDNNEFKCIEIKDFNKAYEKLALAKREDLLSKNIEGKDESEILEWKPMFIKAKVLGKYSVLKYIKNIDTYFNIDIYNGDRHEFHLIFEKLSKQHMKLSSTFRKSPFIAWIKDKNGVYADVNDKMLEVLNKTYDQVIGLTDYEINAYTLYKNELVDRIIEQDNEVIKNNELRTYENLIYVNEYKKQYMECTKWPYTSEDNDIILGTIGIAFEITDKVELRKNIEKNEQTLFEIGNSIDDIILIRDKNKAHYVSPCFEKIYGISAEEMNLYENINNWFDYWDSIEFEKYNEGYECKKIFENTVRITKRDIIDKWLHVKHIPILDDENNKIKEILIISDITDDKKLENELNNLRMDFFANLSHELRTPINLILSSMQVINLKMDKLKGEELDYFSKYLGIVNQNGMRLLKLVNNLIDTTRLDSGHFDHNPKNNDIISYIENICISVCEFVDRHNLSIVFDTNIEEKIIGFDQDNIERIILNLISNAIKFNKPNGEIIVTITCEDNIKISVKDTGIGIPKDKKESIFGRFEQVNSKFKREKEGSGIGLSLVSSLVKISGGTIDVNSQLGKGSEFVITLPDILVNEDAIIVEEITKNLIYVNKMNVEFSDIYT